MADTLITPTVAAIAGTGVAPRRGINSTVYLSGFEWGSNTLEVVTNGAGASVQSSNVITGAYSYKVAAAICTLYTGMATTASAIRLHLKLTALPGSDTEFIMARNTTPTTHLSVRITSGGNLKVVDAASALGLTTTTGTKVLTTGIVYTIEIVYESTANGKVRVYVDNVLDIDTTHTTEQGNNIDRWGLFGLASPNEPIFDDIRIESWRSTRLGEGRIIARSVTSGTPTSDSYTKSNASTIDTVWADIPFSATTNAASSTSGQAQLAFIDSFSSTISARGSETIQSTDTINAWEHSVVAKSSIAGQNFFMRRRINSSNTDPQTLNPPATTDTFCHAGPLTGSNVPSLTNLNAGQYGVLHSNSTNTETIEDLIVIADFAQTAKNIGATVGSFGLSGVAPSSLVSVLDTPTVNSETLTGSSPPMDFGIYVPVA